MQIVNFKTWQEIATRGLTPQMDGVKTTSDFVGFTLEVMFLEGRTWLTLCVHNSKDRNLEADWKGVTRRISFEEVFPDHAIPEGAIDLRSFCGNNTTPTEACGMGLEALLTPKARLEIELRPGAMRTSEDEVEFGLYIGTFVTTARVPMKDVGEFLEAISADVEA